MNCLFLLFHCLVRSFEVVLSLISLSPTTVETCFFPMIALYILLVSVAIELFKYFCRLQFFCWYCSVLAQQLPYSLSRKSSSTLIISHILSNGFPLSPISSFFPRNLVLKILFMTYSRPNPIQYHLSVQRNPSILPYPIVLLEV